MKNKYLAITIGLLILTATLILFYTLNIDKYIYIAKPLFILGLYIIYYGFRMKYFIRNKWLFVFVIAIYEGVNFLLSFDSQYLIIMINEVVLLSAFNFIIPKIDEVNKDGM